MTNSSEAAVLAALRRTTLAYLTDLDFKEVEKAVERDGILSLQGTVATVVKDAVLKHGSHNQSSHGRKGGGGSGGGGGGAASSESGTGTGRDDKLVDQLATDVDELKEEVDEYYNDLDDDDDDDVAIGQVRDALSAATTNMDNAANTDDIDKHEAFMDTAEGHLRDAANAASFGSRDLQDQFKRPIERLADQAMDYLVTLDADDD